MVLRPVHEEALRATARVVGLGALLGCTPNNAEPSAPASDGQRVGEPAASEPAVIVEQEPEAAPVEPAPGSLEHCRTLTAAAFDESQAIVAGQDVSEVERCCQQIAEAIDAELAGAPTGSTEWNERSACCSQLDWQGSFACTPWGPSAPPALRSERVHSRSRGRLDLRAARGASRRGSPPRGARTRQIAIETWRRRMVNEYESARVFVTIAAQLRAAGFGPEVVREWSAFADEERAHGVLCGAVVEALGGEAVAPSPELAARGAMPRAASRGLFGEGFVAKTCSGPTTAAFWLRALDENSGARRHDALHHGLLPDVPLHPDTNLRFAALRNVMSVACLAETVAVALIGAERLEMDPGPLRELLTRIYAEEIGHANAGWRLLRTALGEDHSGALAADLRAYLPVALADFARHELAHLPLNFVAPRDGANWGLCDGAEARLLMRQTLVEVIQPGLERLLAPRSSHAQVTALRPS